MVNNVKITFTKNERKIMDALSAIYPDSADYHQILAQIERSGKCFLSGSLHNSTYRLVKHGLVQIDKERKISKLTQMPCKRYRLTAAGKAVV